MKPARFQRAVQLIEFILDVGNPRDSEIELVFKRALRAAEAGETGCEPLRNARKIVTAVGWVRAALRPDMADLWPFAGGTGPRIRVAVRELEMMFGEVCCG